MTDLDDREQGVDALLRASALRLQTASTHASVPEFTTKLRAGFRSTQAL